jgi:hypothetical protein
MWESYARVPIHTNQFGLRFHVDRAISHVSSDTAGLNLAGCYKFDFEHYL